MAGGLGALIGVFHDGRLNARVQQVTTRQWPIPNGVSSRARTVAVDESLAARCERLLGGLGWHGLVELQFLTGADDVPHLIDLNGRFFGSMALSVAARPGILDLWGRMALGEAVENLPDAPPDVRFTWLAADLRRALFERRGGLFRDALGSVGWAAGSVHSVWDRRDPAPTGRLVTDRFSSADPSDAARPAAAQPASPSPRARAA